MEPKPPSLGPKYAEQFQDAAVAAVYRKRPPYPESVFAKLAELVPTANRTLLDLGTGTGELAVPMAQLLEEVHAVEPSAAMLDVARARADAARVHWFNVPAETFEYPLRYGLITCGQSLHWMDWEVLFPKLVDALDADGYLAIVGMTELIDQRWAGELKEIVARYSTNQEFVPFDLIEGLQSRGLFDPVGEFETTQRDVTQSVDDYVDSIHARNGFSRDRMTAAAAEAFDLSVRELLSAYHPGYVQGDLTARIWWGRPGMPA